MVATYYQVVMRKKVKDCEREFDIDENTVIINLVCRRELKALAQHKAISQGLNLSSYIRNLIIKDNE